MDGIALIAIGIAIAASVAIAARAAYRRRRLPVADVGVRCPENNCAATVTVRTDPAALTGAEYVEVVGCSLLSDAAVRVPARTAYLPDAPSLPLLLEPDPGHPVFAATPPCGRGCVHVLNEASPGVARPQITYTWGATDAIELLRRAERRPRITRLLWYGSA